MVIAHRGLPIAFFNKPWDDERKVNPKWPFPGLTAIALVFRGFGLLTANWARTAAMTGRTCH